MNESLFIELETTDGVLVCINVLQIISACPADRHGYTYVVAGAEHVALEVKLDYVTLRQHLKAVRVE